MAFDKKRLMAIGLGLGKKKPKAVEEPVEEDLDDDDGLEYGADDEDDSDMDYDDSDGELPSDETEASDDPEAPASVTPEQRACAADVRSAIKSGDDDALAEALLALLDA